MGDAETRAGLNEGLFREVNERIAELDERVELAPTEFVCECADASCSEHVQLSDAEYEAVRADPVRFFVMPGHERRHRSGRRSARSLCGGGKAR
jgi:hypothetical protein